MPIITPRPNFILNQLAAPGSACFALRRVNSKLSIPLVNVRRSSDNATRDIYWDNAGNLDIYDLLGFCGSGSGYITTWYDQTGNGYHATQATPGSQPQIVNAGGLVTQKGRPAISFNGTSYCLTSQMPFSGGLISFNIVATLASASNYCGFLSFGSTSSSSTGQDWNTSTKLAAITQSGTILATNTYNGTSIFDLPISGYGVSFVETVVFALNSQAGYINGALAATASKVGISLSTSAVFIGARDIGGGFAGSFLPGNMQEIYITNSSLSTADRQALEHNQQAYFGIAGV